MATLIRESRTTGAQPRYQVWHAFNIPNNMDFYAVESPEEARTLISELVRADLASPFISSNAFGLEELEEDGYHEWYDEEGRSITDEPDED